MTLLEIKKRARFLAVGNETSTAYADAPLLASINSWWETLVGWIEDSSGTWQFADSNNTTLQEATADLPDGTFDIELPTGARILFDVYIKRATNGEYTRLTQLDRSEVGPGKRFFSIKDIQENDGEPLFYDIEGNTILLYPDVDPEFVIEDEGLLINVSSDVILLVDDADVPGTIKELHEILAVGAAIDYSLAKENPTLERNLMRRMYGNPSVRKDKGLRGLVSSHYSKRNKDKKSAISPQLERYN